MRDRFYPPTWDPIKGAAVEPYCDLTESHWIETRPDQIYSDNFHVIPFFDKTGNQLQLNEQIPIECQVFYKSHMERTGISLDTDNRINIITPPVLGIHENAAVFLNWPRRGRVEQMSSLCEETRQALGSTLFALIVRTLQLDYYNIPALR